MVGIIEQFCDAYAAWDERSGVGDVYLTPIMQYLGGHVRRGNDPHELGEYEIEDLRHELVFLTDRVRMDAAFLVASLIRAVEAELVATSDAYDTTLETLPLRSSMEQIFTQYGYPLDEQVVQRIRHVLETAWRRHEHPSDGARRDQQRIADWRELMAPILDRDDLKWAQKEQWGEPD